MGDAAINAGSVPIEKYLIKTIVDQVSWRNFPPYHHQKLANYTNFASLRILGEGGAPRNIRKSQLLVCEAPRMTNFRASGSAPSALQPLRRYHCSGAATTGCATLARGAGNRCCQVMPPPSPTVMERYHDRVQPPTGQIRSLRRPWRYPTP